MEKLCEIQSTKWEVTILWTMDVGDAFKLHPHFPADGGMAMAIPRTDLEDIHHVWANGR